MAGEATASVGAPTVVYETRGCATAAEWRVGYQLYWVDENGRRTTRRARRELLLEAREFVDGVGIDSACALRMRLEVFDMGSARWAANSHRAAGGPPGNARFIDRRRYDAAFYRFPAGARETLAGQAFTNDARRMYAAFPVTRAGHQVGCSGCRSHDPWSMLLMHEWLHLVVYAYSPPIRSWPVGDVHGACRHGYTDPVAGCNVIESYFADMLQGRVVERGERKGLLPADVRRYGTPRARRRPVAPNWSYRYRGDGSTGVVVTIADRYDGVASIRVRRAGRRVVGANRRAGQWRFRPSRPGRYTICVDEPATRRFHARLGSCASFGLSF